MVVFVYPLLRPYNLGMSSLLYCMSGQLDALATSGAPEAAGVLCADR